MVEGLVIATADDRQLVGMLLQMRKRLGDRNARLAALFEFQFARQERLLRDIGELGGNLAETLGHFLAGQFVQHRLGIEGFHLAGPAGHHQKDDRFGLGRKMLRLGGQWIDDRWMLARQQIGTAIARQQIQQCPSANAAAQVAEQVASGKSLAPALAGHSTLVNKRLAVYGMYMNSFVLNRARHNSAIAALAVLAFVVSNCARINPTAWSCSSSVMLRPYAYFQAASASC